MSFLSILRLSSRFYRYATSLSEVIEQMNLKPEVIEFINSIDEINKQFYVAALRKNPNLTIEELKNIKIKDKKNDYDFFNFEKNIVNNLNKKIQDWAYIWIKRLRKGKEVGKRELEIIDVCLRTHALNTVEQISSSLSNVKITPTLAEYIFFLKKLPEISDWYDDEEPQLGSLTASQAVAASKKWHEEIAAKGKTLKYQEGPENIVYKLHNGWTIRMINSSNDLSAEGYKLNHCVGSYDEYVKNGTSTIYSLRDTSNNPHVTMEAQGKKPHLGNSLHFEQIMGHSNSDPKPEYKAMIREWFDSLKYQNKKVTYGDNSWSDVDHWPGTPWNDMKKIIYALKNDENEYGASNNFIEENSASKFFNTFYRFGEDSPDEAAEELAEILHEKDKKLYQEIKDFEKRNKDSFFEKHPSIQNNTYFLNTYFNKMMKDWENESGIYVVIREIKKSDERFEEIDSPLNQSLYYHLENFPKEPMPEDYEDGENDEEYLDDIKIWNEQKEKAELKLIKEYRQDFPYNFMDALKKEMKGMQNIDPIPIESWMRENNWGNL